MRECSDDRGTDRRRHRLHEGGAGHGGALGPGRTPARHRWFRSSDTREALRHFFEVDAEHIAYAALHGLCLDGRSTPDELERAIGELGIDPERVNPLYA